MADYGCVRSNQACPSGAMSPMTVSTMAMAVSARSIPLEGWGMYSYSPYSHLLGNAHHIPQLNLDFRKAFFKRF